jgi:C-terminal processing protease CtpA/Prc
VQRRLSELGRVLVVLASFAWSPACSGGSNAAHRPPPGSIGAVLGQSRSDGRVTIRAAPPGFPAARAGLDAGDELLLIDGRDVRTMSPEAIHLALEGAVGTTVQLTLLRRGKVLRVALERAPLASAQTK